MAEKFFNYGQPITLVGNIDPSVTEILVDSDASPVPLHSLAPGDQTRALIGTEIIVILSVDAVDPTTRIATLTVERGAELSDPTSHPNGAPIYLMVTAGALDAALAEAAAGGGGSGGGGGSITGTAATLDADVAAAANVWTTGLTLSLDAGTWIAFATLTVSMGAIQFIDARLLTGGTDLRAAATGIPAGVNGYVSLPLITAPFTLTETTDLTLQAFPQNVATIRAGTHPGVGNQAQATRILALQVA